MDNAKTETTEADQKRLIASLEKLSNGEDIESVVDIEQVIRYFVVHNYVCNDDSYTGSMIHNYYLYEEDGQLAMIPWDYNLAFGTFTASDANGTVNRPHRPSGVQRLRRGPSDVELDIVRRTLHQAVPSVFCRIFERGGYTRDDWQRPQLDSVLCRKRPDSFLHL